MHLLHGLDTSSARLACAIALVPLLIPAQLSILCPWRWISPFQLPPTFLPSPFLQPMLLYWRCDSGAGSGTVGSWEPRFLAACNHQPVLPGTPAWSGISPSLSLPTSWWQARGNLNVKDSSGLIKPWGYSQWLVQTGGQAVAEMLYYHGLEKWRKSFFFFWLMLGLILAVARTSPRLAQHSPSNWGLGSPWFGLGAHKCLAEEWRAGSGAWWGEVQVWYPNVCGPEPVARGNMKKGEGEIAVGCSSPPQSAPPSWPLRLCFGPEEPQSGQFLPIHLPFSPQTFPLCARGSGPAG